MTVKAVANVCVHEECQKGRKPMIKYLIYLNLCRDTRDIYFAKLKEQEVSIKILTGFKYLQH